MKPYLGPTVQAYSDFTYTEALTLRTYGSGDTYRAVLTIIVHLVKRLPDDSFKSISRVVRQVRPRVSFK